MRTNATSLSAVMWRCTRAYMIRDSSAAIKDYPHTRILTHGPYRHSHGFAESCVSVGLVTRVVFGTIVTPRINMFDCQRQIKIKCIRRHCNQFVAAVIRYGGIGHITFFSDTVSRSLVKHIDMVSVMGKKSAYRYRLKITYSV